MTVAARLAWRELRGGLKGGLRGFRIFLLCLALGVVWTIVTRELPPLVAKLERLPPAKSRRDQDAVPQTPGRTPHG